MAQPGDDAAKWSFFNKLVFCFFFIFFLLYIILNPNDVIPYSFYIQKLYTGPIAAFFGWLAKDVLHLVNPAIRFYNGTIDTVFGYVTALFIFIAALFGSLAWAIADRKKTGYPKLYNILIWILRYFLAISWLAYGAIKIARLQFPPLSPAMLLQTYGNSTPKELAWAFMGYSAGYNYFIGITECAVGVLLFFRRTSTLGNLVGFVILTNVLAFNYTYDVNVKLLATVLIAMTLFLLSRDIIRLTNFFLLNKAIEPIDDKPFTLPGKRQNIALRIAKSAFILLVLIFDLHSYFARSRQFDGQREKPPLFGIYKINSINTHETMLEALPPGTIFQWTKLAISVPEGNACVLLSSDSLKYFAVKVDTVKEEMTLSANTDTVDHYTFIYSQPRDSMLVLNGKWHSYSLTISLRQCDMNKFPLLKRKFRWIVDHNAAFKN